MVYEVDNTGSPHELIEVKLNNEDSFLIIKETLTRIGIKDKEEPKLYQSCYILHKKGKYYIVHFKNLRALDGIPTNFTLTDRYRLNAIVGLLEKWGLVTIIDPDKTFPRASARSITVIPHNEKDEWQLVPKYDIGIKKV